MAGRTLDGAKPTFWREEGVWYCRVPPSGEGFEKVYQAWDGGRPDWWKRRGLIGRGDTQEAALLDLKKWERAAKIVAEIY